MAKIIDNKIGIFSMTALAVGTASNGPSAAQFSKDKTQTVRQPVNWRLPDEKGYQHRL
jgi:hypothetical protein